MTVAPDLAGPLPAPPLTRRGEFVVLLASTIGLFSAASLWRLTHAAGSTTLAFSDARIFATLAIELLLALLWVPYLRRRGWTIAYVTRPWSTGDVGWGLALVAGSYAAHWVTFLIVAVSDRSLAVHVASYHAAGSLSWSVVVTGALMNPVFEETLYLGYATNVVRNWYGLTPALLAGVAARVVVHLYQGPLAFVSILPVGVVLSLYYLRTGRLWPVIVAHMVLDAMALGALARGPG